MDQNTRVSIFSYSTLEEEEGEQDNEELDSAVGVTLNFTHDLRV